ncbi:hypothetical protein BKA65DRAFT_3907 [Rhexocercosporidium sp. MPI-PUGE-AT-0058]|nr:hypothetical protein BKA65DRAFT_3907 [Rhexocercosporidium sp. MPI-PUGE-AT-0058]
MAPSEKDIVDGIYAAIKTLHSSDPETLTVRNVRNKAEADLGLETGLLSNESWKDKSKKIIKDYASELADATEEPEAPASKPKVTKKAAPAPKAAPVKKGTKRAAPEPKARATKRQKKEDTPSEDGTSELTDLTPSEESEASAFGDSEDSDAPKKRKGSKGKGKGKAPVRRQSKSKTKVESESEDLLDEDIPDEKSEEELSVEDSDDTEAPTKKSKAKPKSKPPVKRQSKSKAKIVGSDESEEEVDSEASAPKKKAPPKKATPKKSTPKKSAKAVVDSDAESADDKAAPKPLSTPKKDTSKPSTKAPDSDAEDKPTAKADVGSESEMSIVLDPTPKPKRQRAPKGEKKNKEPKAPKAPKAKAAAKAKSTTELSPDEAQIKTLQSQLGKCGMKKIWQFELKQYGDDSKAKIRHLQNVLKDIGMTGRYSDARAREIKEMRELQADLEAVKEGEKAWGLESGRRSRGAAVKRSMKVASDEDDESGEEGAANKAADGKSSVSKAESGSEGDDQPPARKRRVNPELAFLSSEEDSDE